MKKNEVKEVWDSLPSNSEMSGLSDMKSVLKPAYEHNESPHDEIDLEEEEIEEFEEELFFLLDDGRIIFKDGFNYNDHIVEDSKILFETPLLKPYISKFARSKNKNITMANVFKLCVLLDCSPNDLFNWTNWRDKVGELVNSSNFHPITVSQIKVML